MNPARLCVRKYTVEIDIKYGDRVFLEIIFRDSKNMLYKSEDDSTIVIHKNTTHGSRIFKGTSKLKIVKHSV